MTGAELGGALKNVIAIAGGAAIGAGLGDSARAALITRGFAEMTRFAAAMGAQPETLTGLSGLGDLILTAPPSSRATIAWALRWARERPFDAALTVEGAATARAVVRAVGHEWASTCRSRPLVAGLAQGHIGVKQAMEALLSRPLKEE